MIANLLLLVCAALPQEPAQYLPADTLVSVDLDLAEWDARRIDTQAGQALASVNFLRGPLGRLERNWKGEPLGGGRGFGLREMLGANRVTLALTPQSLQREGVLLVARPVALDLATATAGAYFMNQGAAPWVVDGPVILALLRLPGSNPGETLEIDRAWLEDWVDATKVSEFKSLAGDSDWQDLRRATLLPQAFASVWVLPSAWETGLDIAVQAIGNLDPNLDGEMLGGIRRLMIQAYALDRLRGLGFSAAVDGDRIHERYFAFGRGPGEGSGYGSVLGKPAEGIDLYAEIGRCPANAGSASVWSFDLSLLPGWIDGLVKIASDELGMPIHESPEYQAIHGTLSKMFHSLGGHILAVQRFKGYMEPQDIHLEIPLQDPAAWNQGVAELPPELLAGFQIGLSQSGWDPELSIESGKLTLGKAMDTKSPRLKDSEVFAEARRWIEANRGGGQLSSVWITDSQTNRAPLSILRDDGADLLADLGVQLDLDLLQLQDDDYLAKVIGSGWGAAYLRSDGYQMDTLTPLGALPGMVVGLLQIPAMMPMGEAEFDEDEF